MEMRDLTARKKATEKWRKKNPKWWRGKQYVKALNNALRNQNPNAKVWLLAGMPAREWINHFPEWRDRIDSNGRVHRISAVSDHLEPIIKWTAFNMGKPSDVRRFLAPGNFMVVKQGEMDEAR